MRMFLTVEHYNSESKKGFDLHLVRLALDSVIRSSSGASGLFRLRTNLDVRFDSLDFFVNSSPSEPCSLSLQLVSLRLECPGTSSQVSVALPRQLLRVVLCVLGYTTPLRPERHLSVSFF